MTGLALLRLLDVIRPTAAADVYDPRHPVWRRIQITFTVGY